MQQNYVQKQSDTCLRPMLKTKKRDFLAKASMEIKAITATTPVLQANPYNLLRDSERLWLASLSLNTESVILRNAPHGQGLKTMGRMAF